VLGFDTILEDPFGGWSAAGTGTQAANSWQPPFDGIYEITVSVNSAAGAVTNLVAGVGVTGAQFNPLGSTSATAGTSGGAQGSIMKALAGGADYIRGYTWGSPGFSLATAGDPRDTSMEIVFVSE
jgi:hypothetical protein